MSNNKDKDRIINFCVYCGTKVEENQVYCPKCGKLVVKTKPKKESIQKKQPYQSLAWKGKVDISRKCSGCGSIITSTVLQQCPICNTILEKIPQAQLEAQKEPELGFVFRDKKLEPAQKYVLRKETWNFKEGLKIFQSCVLTYIIAQFLIIMLLFFQVEPGEPTEINIFTFFLNFLPEILFGIYPLWYIHAKKHDFKKLGFFSDSKKIVLAVLIGAFGVFGLYGVNYFSNVLIDLFYNAGIELFAIQSIVVEQNQIIRNANFIWIACLIFLLSLVAFSTEILFRGVLHNTLKVRFGDDRKGKLKVIIIVALVYSLLYLLLSFPLGIVFLALNFLSFLFLGVLYEINGNIYNTIMASVFYNVIMIFLIVLI